jgi:hypothetical protein
VYKLAKCEVGDSILLALLRKVDAALDRELHYDLVSKTALEVKLKFRTS